MSQTFVRRLGLLLVNNKGEGLDLSQFRVTFRIEAADVDHPNNAVIRVMNLKPDTMAKVQGEFQYVLLQAGYENSDQFGVIFVGNIKQFRKGKSDAVTTYLDILASDGDVPYNNAFITKTLGAGYVAADEINAALNSINDAVQAVSENLPKVTLNSASQIAKLAGGTIPARRGKVMFGMARARVGQVASRLSCSWSIQNGQVQIVPYNGYLQNGQIIQLSQFTGVIGIPEATDEGIKITTLLNPNITVGGIVKIDERLINQTIYASGQPPVPYNQYKGTQLYATTDNDGFYRVYVVEHEGDSRGQAWYSKLVCLALNPTSFQVQTQDD